MTSKFYISPFLTVMSVVYYSSPHLNSSNLLWSGKNQHGRPFYSNRVLLQVLSIKNSSNICNHLIYWVVRMISHVVSIRTPCLNVVSKVFECHVLFQDWLRRNLSDIGNVGSFGTKVIVRVCIWLHPHWLTNATAGVAVGNQQAGGHLQ